jgi:hypothetical protein
VTIVTASEILAVIDAFLAGHMDALALERWADRHEMAEDVEYAEADRAVVADALFALANPTINGELTPERVREVRAGLLRSSPAD